MKPISGYRGDKDLAYHLQQMNESENQEYDRKISNLKENLDGVGKITEKFKMFIQMKN